MKNIWSTIQVIKRRPIVLWLMALVVFTYLVADKYNPLMPILFGLGRVTGGTVFEGVISFLQLIVDPIILPYVFAALLGISIIGAILLGVFFSGYLHVLNNALISAPRTKGEFSSGVRANCLRVILVTFRVIFFGLLLLLFMSVSSIPAIVLSRLTLQGKTGLNIPSLLIRAVTVFALYFLFIFFRTYILLWYPAVIQRVKKPFLAARKLVNRHFWVLAINFFIFDAALLGFNLTLGKITNTTLIFVTKWVFYTLFIVLYASYVFYAYERYKKDKAI